MAQNTGVQNVALSNFLRVRRAALDPALVGSATAGGRRVPGLRREELARLVGVSVDYYTRLEQGRRITPSDGVLDALAGALRLDPAERSYLFDLVRPQSSHPQQDAGPAQAVRPGLLHLLDTLGDNAAVIVGQRTNVLALNTTARALFTDFNAMPAAERNAVRWMLLDPQVRQLLPNWESDTAVMVGTLRRHAGRHPNDPRTIALIKELSEKSPDFTRFWTTQNVHNGPPRYKSFNHPVVGEILCEVESLSVPEDADQTVHVLMPKAGSPSEDAMRRLADYARHTF